MLENPENSLTPSLKIKLVSKTQMIDTQEGCKVLHSFLALCTSGQLHLGRAWRVWWRSGNAHTPGLPHTRRPANQLQGLGPRPHRVLEMKKATVALRINGE